ARASAVVVLVTALFSAACHGRHSCRDRSLECTPLCKNRRVRRLLASSVIHSWSLFMAIDWNLNTAAVWRPRAGKLRPVRRVDPVRLEDLLGIDAQKAALVANTEKFLAGQGANNALLWGSRGTGKSSLVKALLNDYGERGLRIIEIDKDDLVDLPEIVDDIRELPQRFVIFCDDMSFEEGETGYKHLKSVLEGSIELPPENVLVYATSNRRHLIPEQASENAGVRIVEGELHYGDTVEEKLSLADR